MTHKIQFILILLFSFIMAFGVYDPVFGIRPNVGLVDLFAVILVFFSFLFNLRSSISKLDKSVVYLLLFVFALFFSSVLYGHSEYSKSVFNSKLLIMVVLYAAMLVQFKKKPIYIHYSLLAFSVGVLFILLLLHTALPSEILVRNGRLWIFGENPNSTSARFTLAAIYLVYTAIYDPFKWRFFRIFLFFMSLPIMYTVLLSGSRGSVIALVFSLLVLLYFSRLGIKSKLFFTFILIAVSPNIFYAFLSAGDIAERLSESVGQGSFGARETIWLFSIDIFLNNPIFGVGEPGYFQEMLRLSGRAVDAHNLLLYILSAGGLLSFSLFFLFYKKLAVHSYFILKKGDVLPFVLLLNITLISLKTGGALVYSIMWFVFSIISAYPRLNGNYRRL